VTPTVLRSGPYRFFFYSGDRAELPHVHVERDNAQAKSWLDPLDLAANHGFALQEINKIKAIVVQNRPSLIEAWNEFFAD
jgi:hypothetical protein